MELAQQLVETDGVRIEYQRALAVSRSRMATPYQHSGQSHASATVADVGSQLEIGADDGNRALLYTPDPRPVNSSQRVFTKVQT